jgi:hypothetical protein
MGDIPNYTDLAPQIPVSEIVVAWAGSVEPLRGRVGPPGREAVRQRPRATRRIATPLALAETGINPAGRSSAPAGARPTASAATSPRTGRTARTGRWR